MRRSIRVPCPPSTGAWRSASCAGSVSGPPPTWPPALVPCAARRPTSRWRSTVAPRSRSRPGCRRGIGPGARAARAAPRRVGAAWGPLRRRPGRRRSRPPTKRLAASRGLRELPARGGPGHRPGARGRRPGGGFGRSAASPGRGAAPTRGPGLEARPRSPDRHFGGCACSDPEDTLVAAGLTRRELEILRHLAAGQTNRRIAERLVISERTAAHHVSSILSKLHVATRGEAASVAHRVGLEPVDRPGSDET